MKNDATKWSRQDNVTFRRHEEGGVLIDQARGQVFEANEVGALIWELLAEPKTTTDIVKSLAAQFDEPVETITDDTENYLRSLRDAKLIKG